MGGVIGPSDQVWSKLMKAHGNGSILKCLQKKERKKCEKNRAFGNVCCQMQLDIDYNVSSTAASPRPILKACQISPINLAYMIYE